MAPLAPLLTAPVGNLAIDRTLPQHFTWTFQDPGNIQQSFTLYWSSNGGTTWTPVAATTPNNYVDVAANTFPAGAIQWQVETTNNLGVLGARSASGFFTAVAPSGIPTITYPTTVVSSSEHVDWIITGQQAYQVQRLGDLAGLADPSTVYYDSGQVVASATRTVPLTFPVAGRYEHVRVRAQVAGLWTAWTDVRVSVVFTPPNTPVVSTIPQPANATIQVNWLTAPGAGAVPNATYVELWISADLGATAQRYATNLPINGSWTFWTPASGIGYGFRVIAYAANGTFAQSTWTA